MSRRTVVAALTVVTVGVAAVVGWGMTRQPDDAPPSPEAVVVAPAEGALQVVPPDEPVSLAWGPSRLELAAALAQARALPLDVAAGRVIVASLGTPDEGAAAALMRDQHLAGVILMGGSITGADQVRELAAAIQVAATEDGHRWPAIVSTDQEGGPVSRLAGIVPDLPAFMAAGSVPDKSAVTAVYAASARDMRDLGITVNWAPDADVTLGLADPIIRVRSAGSDPARVAATVVAAVAGYVEGGVVPAVKHFPGHGSVTTDSHDAVPVQPAAVEQLESTDLVPFAAAIDAGAPVVMMAHIAVGEWGAAPATLNPLAYTYVRDELGFTGVVVTDALNMGAISSWYAPGDAEVAALAAGADLLLMPSDPAVARQAIIAAVNAGTLPRERLDEAVARVELLMRWQAGAATESDDAGPGAGAAPGDEYARAFAGTAATVFATSCGGAFVGPSVTISGGWPAERQVLADALASHGITTGGGTSIRLLGTAGASGDADVVVAMDGPWGLASSHASVFVGLYGRSDEALAGLADVLAGAVPPTGQWAVPGLPASCGG